MQESYKGIEEGRTNEENFVCDQHPCRAGAETALLELLRRLDAEEYEISLYVHFGAVK